MKIFFIWGRTWKVLEGWRKEPGRDCSIQGGILPTDRAIPQSPGKEISCPSSERKRGGAADVLNLCGHPSKAKADGFKRAKYKEWGWKKIKIGAAGSILIIQTEILIMDKVKIFKVKSLICFGWTSKKLFFASLHKCQWDKAKRLDCHEWKVENLKFFLIYFLNQALSKLLVVPVFKSCVHHLRMSLTFSWQLRKSCHSHHLGCRERQRNMQRELRVQLPGSEVHLRVPRGTQLPLKK